MRWIGGYGPTLGYLPFFFVVERLRFIVVVLGGRVGFGFFGVVFGRGLLVMALSKQQEMVYDRLKVNYGILLEANKMMGDKTSVVVGGGTALAAFFGAKEILASQQVSLWLIVGSAVASLVAFVAASFVWAPGSTELPGSNIVDEIWEEIIDVDEDVAFANMTNDLIGAIESERDSNRFKAGAFRVMLIAIWIQIFLVLAAVWFGK